MAVLRGRDDDFEYGGSAALPAPKSRKTLVCSYPLWGEKIMKVTTLILALLALALGTGTAMVVSVRTQPIATCGSANC